jgi:hypothetical protein
MDFSQTLSNQENVGNQVIFQTQKSICDLKILCKSYGQISEKGYEND